MLSRFNIILDRDRQTDGHLSTSNTALMRVKVVLSAYLCCKLVDLRQTEIIVFHKIIKH